MQNSEWKCKECGPENGETKQRRNGKDKVGKNDQAVMQWHGAFPAEAEKKCVALVFLVGWKRGKVHDQKICKRKRCQRDDDEYE